MYIFYSDAWTHIFLCFERRDFLLDLFTKNLPIDSNKTIKMNKFLSIFCIALFISTSLAKKSATEQAADTAAELKDKVVEKVYCVYFCLHSTQCTFHFLGKRCS
jgi:hypothetical protein